MRHGSLFSGIGGFDLAAEWMGWENVFHCEWNEFGKRILKYYWPNSISYDDITKTDFTVHRGSIDILTGGFPCQPYSTAGKRLGKEDERHLWPDMCRAIREIRPTWIVGENVFGLVSWNGGLVLEEVQADLEAEGYEVQPYVLPAAGIGAPHRRDRIFFIAHARTSRDTGNAREVSRAAAQTHGGREESSPTSGEQVQLLDKPSIVLGDASNTEKYGGGRNTRAMGKNTEKPECENAGSKFDDCIENASEKTISDGHTDGRESSAREERKSERGGMQQPAGMGSEWDASNPERIRLHGRTEARNIRSSTGETQGEGSEFADTIETNGSEWDASNATGFGCEHGSRFSGIQHETTFRPKSSKEHSTYGENRHASNTEGQREWEHQSKDSGGEDRRFDNHGEVRHAADTIGIGLQSEGKSAGMERGRFGKHHRQNNGANWQNFPTVSPICDGNDGISDRLDGITFSKWRNESIKGGGNAVVPPLIYVIFKAIAEYERLYPSK